jgi:hypothetical protein
MDCGGKGLRDADFEFDWNSVQSSVAVYVATAVQIDRRT